MSGYIELDRTGFAPFDDALNLIEEAGCSYHHTSQWIEDGWNGEKPYLDRINESIAFAANAYSDEIETLRQREKHWAFLAKDYSQRLEAAKRERDEVKQVEFPKRVAKVAEGWRKKVECLTDQLATMTRRAEEAERERDEYWDVELKKANATIAGNMAIIQAHTEQTVELCATIEQQRGRIERLRNALTRIEYLENYNGTFMSLAQCSDVASEALRDTGGEG